MERLIDADKFIEWLGVGHLRSPTEPCMSELDVKKAIELQPTIDAMPVVRGEWIVTDGYPHRVYCSLCHKTNVPNEEWLFERNEYPKFCMWCGAKMEDKPCGT